MSKTQNYIKAVAIEVASKGKPDGDFVTEMTARVKDAVRKVVPNNYRLAVRVAIRRQVATIQTALAGI